MDTIWFALKYPDSECFVALDQQSGGYPYATVSPGRVEYWAYRLDAERYRDRFPKENFQLVRIELRVTEKI